MTRNRYYTGPVSDHYDGTRFTNPGQPSTDRSLGELWRWQSARSAARWPTFIRTTPVKPVPRSANLRVTMVGHMTLLIQVAGMNILTDPVWSERASPLSFVGPKRVTAPGITFEDLPPIDLVLVSHNHYDHLDMATLRRLNTSHTPPFVMPLGNDAIVRSAIPDANIITGDWNDRIQIASQLQVSITRCNHWSARSIGDRRMALWSGFWIQTSNGAVWFAGDTGYGDGAVFRDLYAQYGAPDLALIPIGAYEPRWFMSSQHVNPAEAVRIFQDIGARHALGIHWGTFQLTDEGRDAPAMELATALERAGVPAIRFRAAHPGAVYVFGSTSTRSSSPGNTDL
jgi:L-ascorbate metabolism protein UlaG (beta-lactamase superfamily)